MKNLIIRDIRINQNILDHQFFWLELWEELLGEFSIEPYSAPLTNLYWMMYELTKRQEENLNELKRRLDEIKYSELGIENDLIARELIPQIALLYQYPNNNLKQAIEKVKNDYRCLRKDKDFGNFNIPITPYFMKLGFELYKMISLDERSFTTELYKKLEFLTKSFVAELLNRGFSWYYLNTRPSIFVQKSNYVKGDFQLKLNHLFSELLNSDEEWTVLFKILINEKFSEFDEFQGLKFVTKDDILVKELEDRLQRTIFEYKCRIDYFQYQSKEEIVRNILGELDPSSERNLLSKLSLKNPINNKDDLKKLWNTLKPVLINKKLSEERKLGRVVENFHNLKNFSRENIYYSSKGLDYEILEISVNNLWQKIEEKAKDLRWDDLQRVLFYLVGNGEKINENIDKTYKKVEFLDNSDGKVFCVVKNVIAPDPVSAFIMGRNRLLKLINIIRYSFSHNTINLTINKLDKKTLLLNDYRIILQERVVGTRRQKALKFNSRNIESHLNRLKNRSDSELVFDLQNLMHWYGMYLDAQYDVEKFLALWIGLEKMLTFSQTQNIGKKVSELSSKIIALYYLRKILRNFWLDISRINLDKVISTQFGIQVAENRVDETDLFFVIKYDAEEMKNKLESQTRSKLILYRLKKLENIFSTANNLVNWVEKYKYHVENSIWRLYSVRNRIAHDASIDSDITYYLKQLNYFFKICYNNMLYVASKGRFYSLEDITKTYSDKYSTIWENKPKNLVYVFYDLLKNCDIKRANTLKRELKNSIIDPHII